MSKPNGNASDNNIHAVYLVDDVSLDSSSEYIVRAALKYSQELSSYHNGAIFYPNRHNLAEKGIVAASSLVSISEELFIPVRVLVVEGDNAKLFRGTHLGWIESADPLEIQYSKSDEKICTLDNLTREQFLSKFHNSLSTIPTHFKSQMEGILLEYSDVFSKHSMDLGKSAVVTHAIHTGNNPPVAFRSRRVPLALEDKVEEVITDLLDNNIIQPSTSPWNFPIVVVKKKNGDLRLCVDYRGLNNITSRPIFPIPDTSTICDALSGSCFFSSLDLSQGFYQVPMSEADIPKTAFNTRSGQYEFTRMPFGLCGAPATFQRLMNVVLRGENWHKCVIYLDDVLIFGRSLDEHNERLRAVLQRFREANLKLSSSKCCFLQQQISYLGHIISKDGIATDPDKTRKISEWPQPACKKELQSFIGLANYYRRFIKQFSDIVAPLQTLISAKEFSWRQEHTHSFNTIKKALTTTPILSFPVKVGTYILDTDASHDFTGAVLSQVQNGVPKVIAYASNKMTKSQRKYCITRKELLAAYTYIIKFKHYLANQAFILRTDHQALNHILNWKHPNTSQFCLWKAELEGFEFDVVHRSGVAHGNADALSRIGFCQQCEIHHKDPQLRRNVKDLNNTTLVEQSVEHDRVMEVSEIHEINLSDWKQDADPDIAPVLNLLLKGHMKLQRPVQLQGCSQKTMTLWARRGQLRIRGELLYLMSNNIYRLVVPRIKIHDILELYHNRSGHIGSEKLLSIIKRDYYWPLMNDDVILHVANCFKCQEHKIKMGRLRAPLHSKCSGEPFQKLSIDITGPFHSTRRNNKYILGIVDEFSKYIMLIPLQKTDSETVAQAIWQKWICVFGAPLEIHSDRGTNFESELFKQMCDIFGIQKTHSVPYYPQGNSQIERLFRTIKPMIGATIKERQKEWDDVLPIVEMCLRTSRNKSCLFSPYEIIFGKRMRLPHCWQLPEEVAVYDETNLADYITQLKQDMVNIHEKVRSSNELNMQKQKEYYDRNRLAQDISVGDFVVAKKFGHLSAFESKYEGPYEVIKKESEWRYHLQHINSGKMIERNYNQVKKIPRKQPSIWSRLPPHTSERRREEDLTVDIRQEDEPTRPLIQPRYERDYPRRHRQPPLRLGFPN